jgi:flagellar M-ring protein FliF
MGVEGAEGTEPTSGADVMEMDTERSMELRKEIRKFVEENPELAAQMLKVWLRGGEENG